MVRFQIGREGNYVDSVYLTEMSDQAGCSGFGVFTTFG